MLVSIILCFLTTAESRRKYFTQLEYDRYNASRDSEFVCPIYLHSPSNELSPLCEMVKFSGLWACDDLSCSTKDINQTLNTT